MSTLNAVSLLFNPMDFLDGTLIYLKLISETIISQIYTSCLFSCSVKSDQQTFHSPIIVIVIGNNTTDYTWLNKKCMGQT